MKSKLYLLSFAFFFCIISYCQAQIKKGTALLGGSVHFNSQKTSTNYLTREEKNNSYGLSPAYGKAIRQNLVIGGDLFYGGNAVTTSEQSSTSKRRENHYGLGVFLRQYKHLGQSGFYLFLQSRLGGQIMNGKGKFDPNNSSQDTKTKGFGAQLNLNPGITYAITPRIHLETGLNNLLYVGYSNNKTTNVSSGAVIYKMSGFNAGASISGGLDWTVGFRILLPE